MRSSASPTKTVEHGLRRSQKFLTIIATKMWQEVADKGQPFQGPQPVPQTPFLEPFQLTRNHILDVI